MDANWKCGVGAMAVVIHGVDVRVRVLRSV